MNTLDPSAQRLLDLEVCNQSLPIESGTPQAAQTAYLSDFAQNQLPLEPVAEVGEIKVGSIRVKFWRGLGSVTFGAPALLYLHGGGWMVGSPETHEDICRSLANRAGSVVFSPDYRLAPEHPFPAAIGDCATVLRYLVDEASSYGIDPHRIAVGGDSAGGNLGAVLALMSRDGDLPPITSQLLIYPVTDTQLCSDSYTQKSVGFGLTSKAMRWFRDHYIPASADIGDWRTSPLCVGSLVGVAPAFVALAGQDVLHDEGAAYAARLKEVGRVILQTWTGQIHGFVSMRAHIPEGDDALNAMVAAWQDFDPGFQT